MSCRPSLDQMLAASSRYRGLLSSMNSYLPSNSAASLMRSEIQCCHASSIAASYRPGSLCIAREKAWVATFPWPLALAASPDRNQPSALLRSVFKISRAQALTAAQLPALTASRAVALRRETGLFTPSGAQLRYRRTPIARAMAEVGWRSASTGLQNCCELFRAPGQSLRW